MGVLAEMASGASGGQGGLYAVTAHRPTNVTHSLTAQFTGPTDMNLIIAKCTRIEIHMMTPEGLQPVLESGIYGRISCLEKFRPEGEQTDLLFLCTERYNFCVLAYDAEAGQIVTRANGNAHDRIGRPTDSGQIGIVDPSCRMIGLHLYDGLFKVMPMDDKGLLSGAFNIRLEELMVLDIKFMHCCEVPTLLVLFEDNRNGRHLKTYSVVLKDKDFAEESP